eukprot:6200643-Pleurochrysis_carterae.AAC.2
MALKGRVAHKASQISAKLIFVADALRLAGTCTTAWAVESLSCSATYSQELHSPLPKPQACTRHVASDFWFQPAPCIRSSSNPIFAQAGPYRAARSPPLAAVYPESRSQCCAH